MNRLWPILRYEHSALIRIIPKRSKRCRHAPDHPPRVLQAAVADARTLLDVGGAFGTHYWRRASPNFNYEWH